MRHSLKNVYAFPDVALFVLAVLLIGIPAQLFAFSTTPDDKRQIKLNVNHASVSPGTTADIDATVLDENGKIMENPPPIDWVISDDMKQYLRIVDSSTGAHITVVGLRTTPPLNTSTPTLVPVV